MAFVMSNGFVRDDAQGGSLVVFDVSGTTAPQRELSTGFLRRKSDGALLTSVAPASTVAAGISRDNDYAVRVTFVGADTPMVGAGLVVEQGLWRFYDVVVFNAAAYTPATDRFSGGFLRDQYGVPKITLLV